MIYRTVRFCHWLMMHIPIRVCTIAPPHEALTLCVVSHETEHLCIYTRKSYIDHCDINLA